MKNWNSSYCRTNNIDIHFTRTGGTKPPIILLHGLMTSGLCWMDLARRLEQDYDVIMPDARGHGKSGKPDFGYTYNDHANDIIGFIEALRLPPVILLGHSMGGMTAALVASLRADLLHTLVLSDPTFIELDVQYQVYNSDVAQQHLKVLEMSMEEVISEGRRRRPQRSTELLEIFAQARLQTCIQAFDVLIPPNPDYKELMGKVSVPSLLVFGDKGIVSCNVAKELQSLNTLMEIEQIPYAGHSVHLDQPEHFTSTVSSFLASVY
ncbi:MAG: alpha/beta hydrolase [Sphingobacterium sp.]|uniref:alpha/beta fold hydrolase n=1 Tax=unclassified Sphingobacterium TaxID=2609468 RepID=UPI00284208C0|nr:alpha/beta hydrolase [Sphingobacterium sp.]MDR3006801.1 alpha/beta hydrolase [Sphingobacterium sp.]